MDAHVNTASEFCWRICAGRAARWALPRISRYFIFCFTLSEVVFEIKFTNRPSLPDSDKVFTLPTGAVGKYCDEYVCVCVCVCLSVCKDISRTTRVIFINFFSACCLWPWHGPSLAG